MAGGSRLTVLLFTDIVGSTELKTRLGVAAFAPLLERHNAIFESICREFRGEVLKHTGDGFFSAFTTASDAVRAALRFVRALRDEPWETPLSARVGIHVGEVAVMEMAGRPDVMGVAADLASRVMSLASGGQILLTRFAFNDARQFVNDAALRWVAHGPYLLKGVEEPIEVFEVGADGQSAFAAPENHDKARRVVPHDQEQTLGWRPAIGLPIPGRPGWVLERKLGEGGFGEVWLGRHDRTKQHRVFKFCFDVDRLRSFKRELTFFRLLRDALGDRHDIARLYEVKLDEPPFFLESEWTEGGNLIEWADARGGIEKVALEKRIRIVADVADAVAAAHSVGILHKDIKPANVLIHVGGDGEVKPRLADFGIGMLADRKALDERHITATGFTQMTQEAASSYTAGTRLYAPPEVVAGKAFTTRGDIYALGVMLYQMVVADLHRPLAEGWGRDVRDELLRDDIAACVEGDPSRRLAAAAQLAERLRNLEPRRSRRQHERRWRTIGRVAIAASVILAVLLSLGAWGYVRERRLRQQLAASEREAEQRLIASLTFAADASAATDPIRARRMYFDAWERAQHVGVSETPVVVGLLANYAADPPALLTFANKPLQAIGPSVVGETNYIVFSQDGRRLLSADDDCAVKLWDVTTGQMLRTFTGHTSLVQCVQFTPDNKLIVGAADQTIRFWDAETGKDLGQIDSGINVLMLSLSPDGKFLLSGHSDASAMLWDMATRQKIRNFGDRVATSRTIGCPAAISPAGDIVVTCNGENGRMTAWEFSTGRVVRTFTGYDGMIQAIAFSPDGKQLLSAGVDRHLVLWSMSDAKPIRTFRESEFVHQIAISPDGRSAITATADGVAKLWDLNDGRVVRRMPIDTGRVLCAAISPDGRFAAASGSKFTIKLWNLNEAVQIARPLKQEGTVFAEFAFDDHAYITCGFTGDQAIVWDSYTGKPIKQFTVDVRPAQGPVAYSPVAPVLAVADRHSNVELWDYQRGEPLRKMVLKEMFGGEALGSPEWYLRIGESVQQQMYQIQPFVNRVVFAPDGRTVACAGWGAIAGFDSQTGRQIFHCKAAAPQWIDALAFNSDGSQIVSGEHGDMIRFWDTSTSKEIRAVRAPAKPSCMDWSLDGRFIACGQFLGDTTLWDAKSGALRATLKGRSGTIRSVRFSPDGSMLATAGDRMELCLWDVASGTEIRNLGPRGGAQMTVAFSRDGQRILSIGADGIVSIWDLRLAPRIRDDQTRLELLAKTPADPAYLLALGEYYYQRQVPGRAIEVLERARGAGANVSPLKLARCYWLLGRLGEAQDAFREALRRREAPEEYLQLCIDAVSQAEQE